MTESLLMVGEILTYAERMVKGLIVFPDKMRKNLDALKGLIVSEKVTYELGKKIGKQTAYEIIYADAQQAISSEKNFKDLLLNNPKVTKHFRASDINRMLNPEGYVGLAKKMTLGVVNVSRRERKSDKSF